MKKLLSTGLGFFCLAINAFDPICINPSNVMLKDISTIIQSPASETTDNTLLIHSVNPPKPIDWSTPGKTFKSIFKNSFIKEGYERETTDNEGLPKTEFVSIKTHFIGHMFMELKCSNYPKIVTGMSSPGYEEISGLLIEGKSFSQILQTTKGHFNTAEELIEEMEMRRTKVGNLQSMGIKLSQNACEELLKYLTEFKACGIDKKYGGLSASPHKAEGAGCSAFALSFLQRINIMPMIDQINDSTFGHQFKRRVYVPFSMLKTKDKEPEVGAWGLLKGNPIKWAKDKHEGFEVDFFDPELFSSYVLNHTPDQLIPGLKYLGREQGRTTTIWFEEESLNLENSLFNIDYLIK